MKARVFVINLDRCVEKKKRMKKRLHNINHTFINAIDGKKLNDRKLKKMNGNVLKEWRDPHSGRNITWGEIGCTLSHYNIYKRCVDNNIENAVILEDDVDIPNGFSKLINKYIDELNHDINDWEFCYLSRKAMNSEKENLNQFKNFVKADYSYWTCSYIINLKGMQKMIKSNYNQNIIPADEILPILGHVSPLKEYYKHYNIQEPLNMYSLKHMICNPEEEAFKKSDTENSKEIETYTDNLLILATGTDMNDGLKRFIESCKVYGLKYNIMGYNKKWNGGGQKINLLIETIKDMSDEQIILVTNSYHVIMTSNSKEILDKYNKFGNKVIFSTESLCYPDIEKIYEYPIIPYKKNIFLNSGGFIGKVGDIKNIITNIKDNYNDQRWYTGIFLKNLKTKKIDLDYDCEIFQCLDNYENKIDINYSSSRITNKFTNTKPCHIHGNRTLENKIILNRLESYLMRNWTDTWGYNKKNIISIDDTIMHNIYINIYIVKDTQYEYIDDYVIEMVKNNIKEVLKVFPNIDYKIYLDIKDRNEILKDACLKNNDYLWIVDTKYIINNKKILLNLLLHNKGVIAPLLSKKGKLWSNFWGNVTDKGWYKSSFDYNSIVEYKIQGCWNVPYISGNILIKNEYLKNMQNFFINSYNPNFNYYMVFSYNCRINNISMYIENVEEYGNIYEDIKSLVPNNAINKDFYLLEYKREIWKKKYLDPRFNEAINDWNKLPVKEPIKYLFSFPFVTELFCDHLLEEVNNLNEWSVGGNKRISDDRINNIENYPTVDIHMKQIGFRKQWEDIIHTYIAPLVSHLYSPIKTEGINISFVIKYEMGNQEYLKPHHDSSTYTILIALNDHNTDFTGGGTRFIKQDHVLQNKKGYCTVHPGRLTHWHEGLPIKSGKRYVMVTFVD
jgi:GR25 family glycosyltransferase involved in LPS biosynthesis